MSLDRLHIENFRCIEAADLTFDSRCNLISGGNASGKTSLLEAVFFLGRGRSFRTNRREMLIRTQCREFLLSGQIMAAGRRQSVGLRVDSGGIEARCGGQAVSGLAELAGVLPVQAIDPEVHRLVEDGPGERRRYLDWGVFHVEHRFVEQWRRYQRALRQRNAALRGGRHASEIRIWEPELIAAGEEVAACRNRYVEILKPWVASVAKRLLGDSVELVLHQGWPAEHSFGEALASSRGRDIERASTQVGPHRADLGIKVGGRMARDRVSRGQQKLLAASLLLAQLRCNAEKGSEVASLLVDDPAAELDSANLEKLLEELLGVPAQLFVTALDASNPVLVRLPGAARFHVEHGAVRALV